MKTLEDGHIYELDQLDMMHILDECEDEEPTPVILTFVNRGVSHFEDKHPGTTCQEVLRVLIDRVEYLDDECPWNQNQELIQHLRMALVMFEARALLRKAEKREIKPETIEVNPYDGHFNLNTK